MISEKTTLSKLPYRNLSKIGDLLEFERVILSVFKNDKNEYFLLYFVDEYIDYDEYLFWKTSLVDLHAFLNKNISLRSLILKDTKEFFFIVHSDYERIEDFNDNESYKRIYQILLDELESNWLPKEDSFWNYTLPQDVMNALGNFMPEDYVNILRNQAIYFKVEPKELKYKTTISSTDAAIFLKLITDSFLTFIIFDFQQNFNNIFNDLDDYLNSLEYLKSILTPRISDLKYSSFEVALSVDDLNPLPQADDRFFAWQRNAIEEYKKEIIDFNFNSSSDIREAVDKYPLDIRRRIFRPLFKLADNPRFTVEISDRRRTFTETFTVVEKEVKRAIVQSNDQTDDDENDNIELFTFVVAAKEGSNIKDLNTRKIRANTLSFRKSDSEQVPYNQNFSFKNKYFSSLAPLTVTIAIKGNYFILVCNVFSIEVTANNNDELFKKLQEEIYNYWFSVVLNNPRSPEAKTFEIYFKVS